MVYTVVEQIDFCVHTTVFIILTQQVETLVTSFLDTNSNKVWKKVQAHAGFAETAFIHTQY